MEKSVSLGDYFDRFVTDQVASGRFMSEGDVVRAGLRLLEEHELKLGQLRSLIDEGDRAIVDGRVTVVDDPDTLSSDIVARGRRRAIQAAG